MRLGRGSVGGGAVVRLGRGHGTQESLFQPISCHSKFHDTYAPVCVMFFSVILVGFVIIGLKEAVVKMLK